MKTKNPIQEFAAEIEAEAIANAPITKLPAGKARGVNKKTAPMTMAKKTRSQNGETMEQIMSTKKPRKTKTVVKKSVAKKTATKTAKTSNGNTLTASEMGERYFPKAAQPAKSFRAWARKNMDDVKKLFKDNEKYVFADNKTTLSALDKLMS